MTEDPRIGALPDSHGHAKGEHKAFAEERPIPYTARMLFLWFFHACRRGAPRFMMVADHINYLTFEDPAAVHVVRRALKLAQAGDLYGAAETAGVELGHASVVSEGLRKGMRYSIGAEIDNDPRSRPDAQNIVDAMKPDGLIRSVHFLPITHPQHGENWMWAFDNPEFKDLYDVVGTERVWELYMETLLDAIEKLPGHIVGHFYVPAKFGHWPDDAVLEGYEDRLIDACAERGMAVEINSRYLYKYFAGNDEQLAKFRAVHLRLMRKAKAKGVMIAVGSDAHSPRDQGSAFETVLEMLDEAEINEIAFPLNDRLARVALRATEEILRQHTAALAAPAHTPPRAAGFADPAEDDDEDESEDGVKAAPSAERLLESRNPNAEIILPPSPEPEAEPEPETAAEPAAAEAKPKPAPRPRKSRAKPKPAAPGHASDGPGSEAADAVASDPAVLEATPEAGAADAVPAAEPDPIPEPAVAAAAAETVPAAADTVGDDEAPPEAPVPEPAAAAPAKGAPKARPSGKTAGATPIPEPPAKAAAPRAAAPKPAPAKAASKKPAAPAVKKSAPAAKKAAPAGKASAKKAPAKKAAPALKKAAPKKAAVKKPAAAKPAPKKAAAKKAPARKPAAKKPAARKPAAAVSSRRAATPKRTAKKAVPKKKSTRR